MSTTSKTRQAAKRGERSKPHYYLRDGGSRSFSLASSPSHPSTHHAEKADKAELALQAFEARIDWSTWGPSRTAK